MKLRSIALALALGTTSIVTTGCGTTPVQVQTDITQIIAQVQSITAQACKFIPTVGTVAAIITANNPGVTTAVAIAEAICNAITAAPPAAAGELGGTVVPRVINGWRVTTKYRGTAVVVATVNGVVIRGNYTQ
jgi:hypothetical protein